MQKQAQQLERILTVFSNDNDELIAEYPFQSFDLSKFKKYFGVTEHNEDTEMYACYPVTSNDIKFVSEYLAEKVVFDFKLYSYFVECNSI